MNVSPKVIASTLAAAVVTIIVAVVSATGHSVSPEVLGAVTTILVFAAGYLKLDAKRSA
jgi:hypothetical protein